jgi:hypothetical protein
MCGRLYRQNRASGGTVRQVVSDGTTFWSSGFSWLKMGSIVFTNSLSSGKASDSVNCTVRLHWLLNAVQLAPFANHFDG